MKERKPLKGAVITFSIFVILFFVCWAACFAMNLLLPAFELERLLEIIKAPIRFTADGGLTPMKELIGIGISYLFVLVAIALAVVSFAGIKKKPGTKALAAIMSIIGIVVAGFTFCLPTTYGTEKAYGVVKFIEALTDIFQNNVISAWLTIGIYGFAVLFFVALIIYVIVAAVFSKKEIARKKAKQEAIAAEEEAKAKAYEEASAPQVAEVVATEESFTTLEAEPVPMYTPEPEPEMEPEPVVEEPKEEPKEEPLDAKSLAAMIREVVREIVKDELARQPKDERPENDNHSVVGATFGGPLVVQYFNGGIQSAVPAPAPAPVEEKKPEPVAEPVKEEPKEEPVVEEPAPVVEEEPIVEEIEVIEEKLTPVEEPAPVVEETPVVEEPAPVVEEPAKKPIIRIPFEERITTADKEMQDNYNEIKNEILSYGVNSRISSGGDSFRLHRKTYVKMTVAGKSLKLYFALDPADYADSKMPIGDASNKAMYAEIPFVFKVKSGLSMRRCKQLIADVMAKDDLEQGEVESVNWVKELKAEMKEREKLAKEGKKVETVEDDDIDDEEE